MSKMHDVIVVGAGPGGSATAYFLAQAGLDVLLLDKAEFPRDKTCGDGLTPRALDVLRQMDILSQVSEAGYRIEGIELHGRKGNAMTARLPKHPNYPDYMLIVPRFELDEIIRLRAAKSGVEFHGGVTVRDIEQFDDHVLMHAEQGGHHVEFSGRLTVLAVGANMGLLRHVGILKTNPKVILAARGYYHRLQGLTRRVQAHFEHVAMPGYGWVFPISDTAANIGIGFWPTILPWRKLPSSARQALDVWLQNSGKLRNMLAEGELQGPVKSYPLRIDFTKAPLRHGRILLIGEAAGLVSPFTGEGIDFALESGQLAAKFILGQVRNAGFTMAALSSYDHMLRAHFQRLFSFLNLIRHLYINPVLMNRAILAAEKFPGLKDQLVRVMLSQTDAAEIANLSTLRRVLLMR